MGKSIDSEDLKKIQMDILQHICDFCKLHDINVFLSGGSLIGAVRHHGYIPWDDDIDVMMLRTDYDKFVKEYIHNDNSCYKLVSFETDHKLPLTFAKLIESRTVFKDELSGSYPMGVNVDIFPIDDVPEDQKLQVKLYRHVKFYINMFLLKQFTFARRRGILKNLELFIGKIALSLIPTSFFVSKIIKLSKTYNNKGSKLCGCVVWGYGRREIHPKKDLSDYILMDFEGKKFPVPVGYDGYLKAVYGNYMQLPPKDKQVTHHHFVAYWK